jgi:hypothetical protein
VALKFRYIMMNITTQFVKLNLINKYKLCQKTKQQVHQLVWVLSFS